jgi:hypothetical protein
MEEYDNEWVLGRIRQLLKQFEFVENESLVIVFGPVGSTASYSHWSCDQKNGLYYREYGLFVLMQNLLETFIEYRNSFNLVPNNHGIIKIEHGKALIEWVNESTADNEIIALKQVSK